MEPSSAKENAPKMERIAPTIHAAKTTETKRPSRAISDGLRKIPVPIIVPTTIAPEAQAPRPRTRSRRFSAVVPSMVSVDGMMVRRKYTAKLAVSGRKPVKVRRHSKILLGRAKAPPYNAGDRSDCKGN